MPPYSRFPAHSKPAARLPNSSKSGMKRERPVVLNVTAIRDSYEWRSHHGGCDQSCCLPAMRFQLSATSGTFDVGTYQRYGYSACIVQPVGDKFEIAGSSGSGGVLWPASSLAEAATGDDVRSKDSHAGQRYWASVRVSGTLPRLGTQISSSYQWMDNDALLIRTHLYLTQNLTR